APWPRCRASCSACGTNAAGRADEEPQTPARFSVVQLVGLLERAERLLRPHSRVALRVGRRLNLPDGAPLPRLDEWRQTILELAGDHCGVLGLGLESQILLPLEPGFAFATDVPEAVAEVIIQGGILGPELDSALEPLHRFLEITL